MQGWDSHHCIDDPGLNDLEQDVFESSVGTPCVVTQVGYKSGFHNVRDACSA